MKLKAPAKINWTLRVIGRRSDGFHELQSWFVPVALADTVEGVAGGPGLEISGPCADGIPADFGNLLLIAEKKWRQAGGVAPPMAWNLHKEIPAGSGLGGGSSDAATALKILQASATQPLEIETLEKTAAEVGSDIPFFLSTKKASLRGGRGEIELAQSELPKHWVVLARPDFPLATAKVYEHSQAEPLAGETSTHAFPEFPELNQLENAAARVHPQLPIFASQLRAYAPFQMTGSGSTFFYTSSSREESARVLDQIQSCASWSTQTQIDVPTP